MKPSDTQLTKHHALKQVLPDIEAILRHQEELIKEFPLTPQRDQLDTKIVQRVREELHALAQRYYHAQRAEKKRALTAGGPA